MLCSILKKKKKENYLFLVWKLHNSNMFLHVQIQTINRHYCWWLLSAVRKICLHPFRKLGPRKKPGGFRYGFHPSCVYGVMAKVGSGVFPSGVKKKKVGWQPGRLASSSQAHTFAFTLVPTGKFRVPNFFLHESIQMQDDHKTAPQSKALGGGDSTNHYTTPSESVSNF